MDRVVVARDDSLAGDLDRDGRCGRDREREDRTPPPPLPLPGEYAAVVASEELVVRRLLPPRLDRPEVVPLLPLVPCVCALWRLFCRLTVSGESGLEDDDNLSSCLLLLLEVEVVHLGQRRRSSL